MTQQLDPKQVRGLSDSMTKVAGLANIKNIGANLELESDGTLNATGGGGGGGGTLYSGYGQNTDGAMTQKASTNLFVHTAPDGENDLIDENNKISEGYLPDYLLGQVLYGGNVVPNTAVATLTDNAKSKLGTTDETITLTNDTADITGYVANEGIYYICTADGTFAGISLLTGDWLISNGSAWKKIDNTDAVTGVKGENEANYRLGNVNLTAENVGAVSSTGAISTETVSPFVTTSMINDNAVTSAKIANGTITGSDIASSTITSSNIDFTTLVTAQPYTVRDGFEYSRGTIYKFGKSIFMNIILKATADASGNVACLTLDNVAVFGSTNTPFKAWEGTDEWTQNTAKGAYTYYNVITIQGGVVNGKYYLLSLPMIQTN